jgi:tRNA pseudouridine38-40 synthase
MSKFKLTIEYEGTRYKGWQVQKGQNTIQGKIMDACREVLQTETFELYGAGRTDAGVHALGQVAHLDVKTNLNPEKIRYKLNDLLPQDINILSIHSVHPRFHARHEAIARSYVYHISQRRTAFGKKFAWWIRDELDISSMEKIALLYTGFKDFRSFGQQDPEKKSTKVNVSKVNVMKQGDNIFIHIVGSHFLWKMVRRMVGVMAEAGRGNLNYEEVESFFDKKSDDPAKYTAPPSGLYLERIYYPGEKISDKFKYCLNV